MLVLNITEMERDFTTVKVVTDSISDIPADVAAELGITVVPCNVHFGQQVYRDGIDLTNEEFYSRLVASSELPTTSQPSAGVFEETYRRLGSDGAAILSIHIPARVSGTLNSAHIARQALPDLSIAVVDSTQVSMALGWLVIKAARAAREEMNMNRILEMVNATIPRLRLLAMLETLEYVYRGGRIGKAQALMGTLLKVKPVIQVLNGEVLPIENVRTKRKALRRLIELVQALGPLEEVAIIHSSNAAGAREVRQMMASLHPVERIPVVEAGPVLGTHAGPGAVGIACVLAETRRA